jgi:hypothetical protein
MASGRDGSGERNSCSTAPFRVADGLHTQTQLKQRKLQHPEHYFFTYQIHTGKKDNSQSAQAIVVMWPGIDEIVKNNISDAGINLNLLTGIPDQVSSANHTSNLIQDLCLVAVTARNPSLFDLPLVRAQTLDLYEILDRAYPGLPKIGMTFSASGALLLDQILRHQVSGGVFIDCPFAPGDVSPFYRFALSSGNLLDRLGILQPDSILPFLQRSASAHTHFHLLEQVRKDVKPREPLSLPTLYIKLIPPKNHLHRVLVRETALEKYRQLFPAGESVVCPGDHGCKQDKTVFRVQPHLIEWLYRQIPSDRPK